LEPLELVLVQALVLARELARAQELALEQVLVPVLGSALALARGCFRRMSADRSRRLEVGSLMQAEPHWELLNPVESLS
jgi:hypothetical protein